MLNVKYCQKGFIALISAVTVSVLLLAITVGLGFSGFFARFNILDSESKQRSSALAEACANVAMLHIAKNPFYDPPSESIAIGGDNCTIVSVASLGNNKIIKTQACINKAVTNISTKIDENFNIIEWTELPNLSPNTPCT